MKLRYRIGSATKRPKMLYVPDTQVGPGNRYDHLGWAGRFARDKAVDIVGFAGDFADMKSLSSYDRGKRAAENQRYQADLDVAHKALSLFEHGLGKHKPALKFITLGNHEERIERYADDHPELYGTIGTADLGFQDFGYQVYPFLTPVDVNGVLFCHMFPRSANGKVTQTRFGSPSAIAQVRREMRSTVAGHTPGLDTAIVSAGGRLLRGMIAGSFYQHHETYQTPQGNTYWRGLVLLHELWDGWFNVVEVSMDWLKRRYGGQ